MKKLITVFVIFLTVAIPAKGDNMKFNLFSDSLEIKFWKYFEKHVTDLDSLSYPHDLLVNVNNKLQEYFPGLGMQLSHVIHSNPITNTLEETTTLYITAYGNKESFSQINKIIEKVPIKFKDKIRAFTPEDDLQNTLDFNGKSIPTDQLQFSYAINNKKIDLNLYFPAAHSAIDSDFELAITEMFFKFLGELNFIKLGVIQIDNIDNKPIDINLHQLKELSKIIKDELN